MIPIVDIKRQYLARKAEIDAAIAQVFDDAWFILGKQGEAFEHEFAAYLGGGVAAAGVGSGTEALHLALVAAGVGPGDEVITVPLTAAFTVSAISFAGATPVFADIDPVRFTLDPQAFERAVTPRTKAVIPVHIYGQAADMGPILAVARRHGITVIEDACQAHGAEYQGKKVGTLGDLGCFSFYPSKNLGAYGDGGMVVARNAALIEKIKLLRNGGQEKRYYHKEKGFLSRLDELQAAILRKKLPHLDAANAERARLAARYDAGITHPAIIKPVAAPDGRHVYHLYVIRCERREALQKHLEANGVQTFIHYPIPVHRQQAYADLNLPAGTCPVAEKYAEQILSLPMFPGLHDMEMDRVILNINASASI